MENGMVGVASQSESQPWQTHKHSESSNSEISYFEPSSTSTNDSWSGYFDDWESRQNDSFCPTIASCESSPTKPKDKTPEEPELLPTACPRPNRPLSQRRDAGISLDMSQSWHSSKTVSYRRGAGVSLDTAQSRQYSQQASQKASQRTSHQSNASRKSRRYGIVPYASPTPGEEATSNLNHLLHDAMANTEDILAAMYSTNWDAASLQKWYQSTPQGPSDLALFKIMFSLRYTADEPSPLG